MLLNVRGWLIMTLKVGQVTDNRGGGWGAGGPLTDGRWQVATHDIFRGASSILSFVSSSSPSRAGETFTLVNKFMLVWRRLFPLLLRFVVL